MALTKHHVAIVNSEECELAALSAMVDTDACQVFTFKSPLQLLNAIHSDKTPDIIITDLHHPDMNGWRLCMLMRSHAFIQTHRIPIIVTTPIFRNPEFKSMAMGLGVDAVVTLPCEPDMMKQTITKLLAGNAAATELSVLAIDDDDEMLQYLSTGLGLSGLKATAVKTGERGLEYFTSNQPDVTILDHSLGDCKAKDIIPALIATRQKADSVIILITGAADPNLAIEYVRLGVDAYVRKPFTIPYLIDIIHKARREHFLLRVVELLETSIKSLSEAEKQSRDLYENAPLGYHVIDPAGLIILMNNTELRWLGYTHAEIVGRKTIFDIQTPQSATAGRKMFAKLAATENIVYGELEFLKKDGTVIPVSIQTLPVKDTDGKLQSCRTIVQDLSERRKIESQLRYAHKFESTRDLVEGVAHNFNNILTPVLVNASHMATEFPKGSEEYAIIDDIVNAARRGADLVKQLSALTYQDDDIKETVNLKKIVAQTANIIRNTLDASIEVVTDIRATTTTTRGNPGQIQQALLNICLNARDAMPDGGRLSLSLDEAKFPGKPDDYLCLSITDTGVGIPVELQSRIFDPFFTTKGLAKNTGLGLSAAYATATIHSGFIDVQSEIGKGSTFRLFLPILQRPNKQLPQDDPPPGIVPSPGKPATSKTSLKKKTILIIDDEAALRASMSTILTLAGYDVECAADGKSGLDVIRKSLIGDPASKKKDHTPIIDLVILDLILPDRSGEQVLEDIRAVSKRMPVIIVTGCHARKRLMDLIDMEIGTVVMKPFDNQALVREVQRFLK